LGSIPFPSPVRRLIATSERTSLTRSRLSSPVMRGQSSRMSVSASPTLISASSDLGNAARAVWGPRTSSESDWMNRDGVRASLTWRAQEVHRHGSQPYGSNSWALQGGRLTCVDTDEILGPHKRRGLERHELVPKT